MRLMIPIFLYDFCRLFLNLWAMDPPTHLAILLAPIQIPVRTNGKPMKLRYN